MPNQFTNPLPLTPQQRLAQVAAIFARGVARLRESTDKSPPENLGESRQPDLEVVSESRLSVSRRPAK
jgi:hypothetical protein